MPGVRRARANLTTRQVRVEWDANAATPNVLDTLEQAGFPATLQESVANGADGADVSVVDGEFRRHLKALAVAGFAAGNVMMLSIAVWSGADGAERSIFHWLSASIALPTLAYAGRIFFASAWDALRHGHMNMDVPISIGVLVTAAMSVYDIVNHGQAIYFDAALMLVFFLLVGRTLDQRVRERARHAADAVARFEPRGADVLMDDGSIRFTPLATLSIGDRMVVKPCERVAVDAIVVQGSSTVDRSLVTGESMPVDVAVGAHVQAGTRNLQADLVMTATADADGSFLASIRQMMQEAEATRGRYRRIADRAASHYAPVVHTAAALAFVGWLILTGDLHHATTVAVAVLIITCPCALGLAVPVVQVLAARRLFDAGIVIKDGAALERLADVDTVVFDKTGTLTSADIAWTSNLTAEVSKPAGPFQEAALTYPLPSTSIDRIVPDSLTLTRALASTSEHPHARALMNGLSVESTTNRIAMDATTEIPGAGIEGRQGKHVYRLGRADWAIAEKTRNVPDVPGQETPDVPDQDRREVPGRNQSDVPGQERGIAPGDGADTVLSRDGHELARFRFHDTPRRDAALCVEALTAFGLNVELLSGDRYRRVSRLAESLGIARARGDALPDDKLAHVQSLQKKGHAVLMIGDGVNDSPAMVAASVSIAPFSAVETGRRAADFLLLQDRLLGIPEAVVVARRARRLVRSNLQLAVLYNLLAMPLAIAGYVTPLVAAVSMSLSSMLVVANALRLSGHDVSGHNLPRHKLSRHKTSPETRASTT